MWVFRTVAENLTPIKSRRTKSQKPARGKLKRGLRCAKIAWRKNLEEAPQAKRGGGNVLAAALCRGPKTSATVTGVWRRKRARSKARHFQGRG